MKKSIAKLIIALLVIVTSVVVVLGGMNISVFDYDITYPNALDEDWGIRQGLDLVGGSVITYEAQTETATDEQMQSVENVLRNRLDSLGYNEATVSRQGEKKVRIEIPAIQDPQEAVETLGKTAVLTFADSDGNTVLEASDVSSATAAYAAIDDTGVAVHHVKLKLNSSGIDKFAQATSIASQKAEGSNYIAIKLDDEVISQPRVTTAINQSECVISGGFTDSTETAELAALINSGNLPFSIKDVELSSIGPTLGEEALKTSLIAAGIGIILILLFMLLIYRLPGLVADIALLAYIAIVVYIMTFFRINLSLAGIAGIILSIGMAVDANVIIFERIKEELKLGKTIKTSVVSGFNRAFIAIIDANITTIIAAVVLYIFGTGTIQGFAITLAIGTVVSMFTAIFVTKYLLNLVVDLKIKNIALYGVRKKKEVVE
ncbi:MAG: protein translocase subunit SecD [Clostridia bacterium]|nr:protein translocase subunit SecD [Clostridia bacterium]